MFFTTPLVMAAAVTSYTGTYPVAIAACSIQTDYQYYPVGGGDTDLLLPQPTAPSLKITFSNSSNEAISSVTFTVSDGDMVQRVVDAGNFSPGATVAHSFTTGLRDTDNAKCSVAAIGFADGSSWMRPVAANGVPK
jgi:hypothetical protein